MVGSVEQLGWPEMGLSQPWGKHRNVVQGMALVHVGQAGANVPKKTPELSTLTSW